MTLPAGWRISTLGEISLSQRNGIFAARPGDSPRGTPVLRISAVRDGQVDFSGARYVQGLSPNEIERYAVKPGDLLFTRYNGSRRLVGICGLVGEHDGPVVHPDKLIRVVVNPAQADSRFVNLQMEAPAARAHLEPRIRTTAGQSGISGVDLRTLPVVLPPLDEQRRIVEVLEGHLSHLDAALRGLQTAERRLAHLRAALGERTLRSEHPKARIQDVSMLVTDGDHNPPRRVPAGVPHLTAKCVRHGRLTVEGASFVSEEGFRQTATRYEPLPGDVIVTCVGTIGRVAVVPAGLRFSADRNLAAIRPRADLMLPEFLALLLDSHSLQQAMLRASGSTAQPHLYLRALRTLEVVLPPIDQQRVVLAEVDEHLEGAALCRRVLERSLRWGESLRGSLLVAGFSGQLGRTSLDTFGGLACA